MQREANRPRVGGEGAVPAGAPVAPRWHVAAVALLTLGALWNGHDWWALERMPPGDFAGYAAAVQGVRDALLEHGHVPRWCAECYGGSSRFTGNLKELLAFPLALVAEPVLATKLAFLLFKVLAGLGLYALVARQLAAPAAGIVAGYTLAFGAVANHQLEHLDGVLAAALLPPTVWAAHALLRGGGVGWAVALGALAAAHLVNNWVFALSVPLLVLALLVFAPWRGDGALGPRARGARRRALARVALALAAFAALAASPLAWLAADVPHHGLFPEAIRAVQREYYVERSPFLFMNRDNVLAPWLETHHPPGFEVARVDAGRRYLGVVVIAVCLVGLWLGRRGRGDPLHRRWAGVAASLLGLQYWLALGPRTLLWEVGTSLHASEATLAGLRGGAWAVSAGLAALALALAVRALRDPSASARGAVRAGVAALLCLAPAASLWSGLARVLPPLAVQRSPGHFFDVAPVWLALLFAVALTQWARRIGAPRRAQAWIAAVALAAVVDFAPSRARFAAGTPLAPLRSAAARIAALPGEGGSLRIGLPLRYRPVASWLVEPSEAGHAWGWLSWQAGRHWPAFYERALYSRRGALRGLPLRVDPDPPLVRAARIRYLLLAPSAELSAPWQRRGEAGPFALWERDEVAPVALAFRAYAWVDGAREDAPALASRALRANTLLLAAPEGERDASLGNGLAPVASLARGAPAPRRFPRAPAPAAVSWRRPAPDRIALDVDAGGAPAVVSVAEGHHPWWRATVDERPASLLRASAAMLAVPIGPGRHAIELRFRPPSAVAAAGVVSGLAWSGAAALALGAAWRRRRRRRRRDGDDSGGNVPS